MNFCCIAVALTAALYSNSLFALEKASSSSPSSTASATTLSTTARIDAVDAAFQYVITFYPRIFTYYQSIPTPTNSLVGPIRVSPMFQSVVAVNDDTLYTGAQLDLSDGPVIVDVPATQSVFSVLHLDQFGRVLNGPSCPTTDASTVVSGTVLQCMPSGQSGTFALVGPNWAGELPAGITQVQVPVARTELIFRVDKYTVTGTSVEEQANQFRESLHLASLRAYNYRVNAGPMRVLPEASFAIPFKTVINNLLSGSPEQFLRDLQTTVQDPSTQMLTSNEYLIATTFNKVMADPARRSELVIGAKAAYEAILADYHAHQFQGSSWIHFNNIGTWADTPEGRLDRAAITEFIQLGNHSKAASYFHTFSDASGEELDGTSNTYVLRFSKDQVPEVSRFWSVTAYLPKTIELVPNRKNKYLVASYTPGLVTNPDGSVTIIISATRPDHFPSANWLPVPKGKFNLMLRAYGPQGSVLDNTYVPPPIHKLDRLSGDSVLWAE